MDAGSFSTVTAIASAVAASRTRFGRPLRASPGSSRVWVSCDKVRLERCPRVEVGVPRSVWLVHRTALIGNDRYSTAGLVTFCRP